jgi:hypothetical protein
VSTAVQIRQVRLEMNALRGRLFQFSEAIGLPERQEDAMKGLIRHITNEAQSNIEAVLREASRNGGTS